MSDTIQELADIPRDFLRDGMLFVRRCTKPDKREFIKISQAVGMGFIIMNIDTLYFAGDMLTFRIAIGYFIKLSKYTKGPGKHATALANCAFTTVHIPVNNILVGGA
ncbi:translocon subunit SSS1 [Aspergillus thermomutatus]|uniref:Uncharacterized protein n=1 Tax=Aspergillus thermomutatus TaxID=41047 RepID=A0A397G1T1_ASPTH|nr:uncharacterized protein CDV56_100604 [Aspergillus thermomutatus]RHZ43804.1 hypothetical protein CDV56_100604 [Aspergillus thermomutatus]